MPTSLRKRLDDLVTIGESIAWSIYPEPASQRMVDALAGAVDCELAFIHLLDVAGDHLIKFASHGEIPENLSSEMRLSITTGRMQQLMKDHKPIIMDFRHPDPADQIPLGSTMFGSAISVPLLAGDAVLGMYSLVFNRHKTWTEQDLDHFVKIGRLLGLSVQHAQTARKAADLEILIERKRLGGELHDNLAQLVGSINLNAEAALLSLAEGNPDRLRNDLERLRCIAQEATRTLREEMLVLRTPTNATGGLISEIRHCVSRFGQQWGIEADLQVESGLEPLSVSTQVEMQFIRILQESLMNILRHATATCVGVTLTGDQTRLVMDIQDNGRGFDPDAVSADRLGLQIMSERAESLGGTLTVQSASGSGTRISVDVPLYARSGGGCA